MKAYKANQAKVIFCSECFLYGTRYVVVLSGDTFPGAVLELVKVQNGIQTSFALIEVIDQNIEGNYQAKVIWAIPDHSWGATPGIFIYPNIKVATPSRAVLEQYMAGEGQSADLSHVVEIDGVIIVIYRRSGESNPWICYALDQNSTEFVLLTTAGNLTEMKAWLCTLYPAKQNIINGWGYEGAQIFNVLDYGVIGDSQTDCTALLERVFRMAKRGDTIYFPHGHTFVINKELAFPVGVNVDVLKKQIIVREKKRG